MDFFVELGKHFLAFGILLLILWLLFLSLSSRSVSYGGHDIFDWADARCNESKRQWYEEHKKWLEDHKNDGYGVCDCWVCKEMKGEKNETE